MPLPRNAPISSLGLVMMVAGVACAQDYPNKLIRIATLSAGGGNDVQIRLIAPNLSGFLGQPVIVDNRGVALAAIEAVSKAPPDGHTLLVIGGSFWAMPLLQKMPYDVARDFSAISQLSREVCVVSVHPSLPVKSVRELVALARARPGQLNFATSSIGGATHMAGELFKSMAGVSIVNVNYKGSGPAIIALIGGEVHIMFANAPVASPHLKSGKLRGLAVTSATPSDQLPGLPTVAASGLPGFDATSITGMFAPAKTPAAIINRLNQELVRIVHTAEMKEKFLNAGVEAVGNTSEEFTAIIKADVAKISKLMKDAGVKTE